MSETEKRGPGRPENFPGQETENIIARLPATTAAMVRQFAKDKGKPLGVALDILLRRAHMDMTRKRGSKDKAPVAP